MSESHPTGQGLESWGYPAHLGAQPGPGLSSTATGMGPAAQGTAVALCPLWAGGRLSHTDASDRKSVV